MALCPLFFVSLFFKSIWYTILAEQLPGTPCKLPLSNLLWNGNHFQYVQANSGVMIQLLHKSTVYYIPGEDLWFVREENNRGLNRLTCSCHMHSIRVRTRFCYNCYKKGVAICWLAAALPCFSLQDVTENTSPHPMRLCWLNGAEIQFQTRFQQY